MPEYTARENKVIFKNGQDWKAWAPGLVEFTASNMTTGFVQAARSIIGLAVGKGYTRRFGRIVSMEIQVEEVRPKR